MRNYLLDRCPQDESLAAIHATANRDSLVLAVMPLLGNWSRTLCRRRNLPLPKYFDELIAIGALTIVEVADSAAQLQMNGNDHIRLWFRKAVLRQIRHYLNRQALPKCVPLEVPATTDPESPWDAEPETRPETSSYWQLVEAVTDAAQCIAKGSTLEAVKLIAAGKAESVSDAARQVHANPRTLRDQISRLGSEILRRLEPSEVTPPVTWAEAQQKRLYTSRAKAKKQSSQPRKSEKISADLDSSPIHNNRGSVVPRPHFLRRGAPTAVAASK